MKLTKTKMDKLRKIAGLKVGTSESVIKQTVLNMLANDKIKLL